jgi:hypothetical protein
MEIATLIDKLTNIELSIEVRDNLTIRNMVIDLQNCLLQMQKEKAERLQIESERNIGQGSADHFPWPQLPDLDWNHAFTAFPLHSAASPLPKQ